MHRARDEIIWLLAAVACVTVAVIGIVQSQQPVAAAKPTTPPPAEETPEPQPRPSQAVDKVQTDSIGAATTITSTVVRSDPTLDAPVVSWLRAGITLPVDGRDRAFLYVLTPCEVGGWIPISDLELHPKAAPDPSSLEDATLVLDPGHGGLETGATGPGGLTEKEANLDIARRLVPQLGGARVFLTRNGDFTAGLGYRAKLATALGAHAFVSIHNNAVPTTYSQLPGTETYHQVSSETSKILATLLWQDLFEELKTLEVAWVSNPTIGPKARRNHHGTDYYALLRGSGVPAVIVEAMFISNPPEEELLRSETTRDAVAGALGRGLATYITSGTAATAEPYPHSTESSWQNPGCVDPNEANS